MELLKKTLILAAASVTTLAMVNSVEAQKSESKSEKPAVNDSAFHKTLLDIAGDYQRWGKISDRAPWAPALCAMPLPEAPKMSASSDDSMINQLLADYCPRP